jgi:hypothetical protein
MKDPSRQANEGKGFAISDFDIDWENKRATCPQVLPGAKERRKMSTRRSDLNLIFLNRLIH